MRSSRRSRSKSIRFGSRVAVLLATSLSLLAQTATLQRLTSAQVKDASTKLDLSKLPPGAEMRPYPRQDQQQLILRSPGADDLTLVPILFTYNPSPGKGYFGPGLQCGVYFVKPDGRSDYVGMEWPTIQVGEDTVSDDMCLGVLGVTATRDRGPRPRLIFLVNGETEAGPTSMDPFPVPYILRWNMQASKYEIDAKPTIWVQNQAPTTVAAARRLLAQYDAKQTSGGQ